jgi:chromosome segregation ATPase
VSTTLVEFDVSQINYPIVKSDIDALREKYTGLTIKDGDKGTYELVRRGIADCRNGRVSIEEKRKELKDGALKYGRAVDAAAKALTADLESIEGPLQAEKDRIDNAEKLRLKKIEDERLAKIAAEEKAKRDAEEAELKRQREELAAKQAEIDRVAAEQRAAQEKIDAENRKLEAAKAEAARAEAARLQKIKDDEAAATAKALKELQAAEQARLDAEAKAEADRIEAARLEALKPDKEKMRAFADMLANIDYPEFVDKKANELMAQVHSNIFHSVNVMKKFCDN